MAEELTRLRPDARIAFVGARRGLEQRLVPRAGYPLLLLSLSGLKGASLPARILAVAAAGWAVLRCAAWMLWRRPDLVIGVGGYASGPAVLAASWLRVRTMVLEQNHYPGATNRWLSRRVDAVCLPSEAARRHVEGRTFVTGNPVRHEFAEIGEPPHEERLSLLIFGGSRGARSINNAATGSLDLLARLQPAPRIVHQTGTTDEPAVRAAYERYPAGQSEVRAFFDDMPARLAGANLAVCRAGASTIAELCAAGRPSILVPYPHAADDHQRKNAEVLQEAGAAIVLADEALEGGRLAACIAELNADPERRLAMGRAARRLALPEAGRRIAELALRLIEGRLDEPAPG